MLFDQLVPEPEGGERISLEKLAMLVQSSGGRGIENQDILYKHSGGILVEFVQSSGWRGIENQGILLQILPSPQVTHCHFLTDSCQIHQNRQNLPTIFTRITRFDRVTRFACVARITSIARITRFNGISKIW